MAFNADAVNALFAALVSVPQQLGVFEVCLTHAPKNAPVSLPACAYRMARLFITLASCGSSISAS